MGAIPAYPCAETCRKAHVGGTQEISLQQLRSFIRTSILGGVIVLLPISILFVVFRWMYGVIRGQIKPLTDLVTDRWNLQEFIAFIIVIGIILAICFVIGVFVRTTIGRFLHEQVEQRLLRAFPGYSIVRETVLQFLGGKRPFSTVCLCRPFGNDCLMLGFVTDHHDNGWLSVFVPTGPNPTTGYIFHLRPELVQVVDHPVDDAMRSIISWYFME